MKDKPKADKQLYSLYGGSVQIEFTENPYHKYVLLGEEEKKTLLSVTAVTGVIDKSGPLMFWAIGLADKHLRNFISERGEMVDSEELLSVWDVASRLHTQKKTEAADFGSLVHAWAEGWATAQVNHTLPPPVTSDLPMEVANGINAFLDWTSQHKVRVTASESLVYSMAHDYVGKLDAVADVDGVSTLVDYKTAKAIYPEAILQTSAYWYAWNEEHPEKLLTQAMIARFDKETGEFETRLITFNELMAAHTAFRGLLAGKKWLKEQK